MSGNGQSLRAVLRRDWALNRLPTSSCYDCFRDELVGSGATYLGRLRSFSRTLI